MIKKANSIHNKNSFKKYLGINLRVSSDFIAKKLVAKKQQYILNTNNSTRSFINFYKDINSYTGLRHKNNLPTRGQRTRTNAKTRKKRNSKKK